MFKGFFCEPCSAEKEVLSLSASSQWIQCFTKLYFTGYQQGYQPIRNFHIANRTKIIII